MPDEAVLGVYEEGHRHFGENYVLELVEKSQKLPDDIRWHFIGHLQSNKVKQLMTLRNLYVIESVDSLSLAKKISKESQKFGRVMSIYLQVNTSLEPQKGGVSMNEVVATCDSILKDEQKEFTNIALRGLMTIGKLEGDPKEDFQNLLNCRKKVATELNIDESSLDLSMGMSADYEQAIDMGSTNVRVGSLIFGARVKK